MHESEWLAEPEPPITREDTRAILLTLAHISAQVDEIKLILEDDDEAEEEDS